MLSAIEPQLTCDFEKDFCSWSNDRSRDSEDWIRNKGLIYNLYSIIRLFICIVAFIYR